MKKNTYLISLIVVAIIFCIIGFLIGKGTNLGSDNNSSNNNEAKQNVEKKEQIEAYKQGWSYWFSGYGMHGEGAQYVNLYTYGRRYNDKYYQEHDAFIAGYNDGFCYVNRCNTFVVGYGNGEAEKGYEQYYKIDESKRTGTSVNKIIEYSSENNTGAIYGNDTTIVGLIRSEELRIKLDEEKLKYSDLVNGTVVKRVNEKGFEIEVTMYCGNLKKDDCTNTFDYILKFIIDNQSNSYKDSNISVNIKE